MIRGVFVTGTDTGIGKTVVCAALMHRYRRQAPSLRYWKPVQTGAADDDSQTVAGLGACAAGEIFDAGIRLPDPVSPHLAARRKGTRIELAAIVAAAAPEPVSARWIVEGAGGVLVPLNEADLMIDLIAALGAPVLVVARSTLGTINHTTLTLDALRQRSLQVAGVVLVGPPDRDNREAIGHYGRARVLGELPPLDPLTAGTLGEWADRGLDPDGALMDVLR